MNYGGKNPVYPMLCSWRIQWIIALQIHKFNCQETRWRKYMANEHGTFYQSLQSNLIIGGAKSPWSGQVSNHEYGSKSVLVARNHSHGDKESKSGQNRGYNSPGENGPQSGSRGHESVPISVKGQKVCRSALQRTVRGPIELQRKRDVHKKA